MALTVVRSVVGVGDVIGGLMLFSVAFIALTSSMSLAADSVSQCKFPNHKKQPDLSVIQPLIGQRFHVTDPEGIYSYDIGVCTSATPAPDSNYADVGILQLEIETKKLHIVGRFVQSEVRLGTDWAMLEYREGDNYHTHCGNAKRVAVIMITCDPQVQSIEAVKATLITEEKNKSSECYYLFELSHSCMCTDSPKPLVTFGLSIGSICVIVFVVLCGVYLLGGLLYNRFVLGAKGMEQIPNYNFWLDFGNLQADGCSLVCQTGSGRGTSRSYKGIGDDQLGDAEDDRDDHLLPM